MTHREAVIQLISTLNIGDEIVFESNDFNYFLLQHHPIMVVNKYSGERFTDSGDYADLIDIEKTLAVKMGVELV
jgi:hypothetical protein